MTPAEHREAMYGLCIAHITSPSEGRMRMRTAKEQREAALAALQREQDSVVPDDHPDSDLRNNILR